MESITAAPISKKMLWAGRIVSTLPVLMLVFSAVMKFSKSPSLTEGFVHLGYDVSLAPGLGILELICTLLYVLPRTTVLGAILLTGYLGGAITTQLRIGDPFIAPIVLGLFIWGGLYLRDPQLRRMIPIRRCENP